MTEEIHWSRLVDDLREVPAARILLRGLLGHGVTHLTRLTTGVPIETSLKQSCSITYILDEMARSLK